MPSIKGEFVEGVHYLSVDDISLINQVLIQAQTPSEPVCVLSHDLLASSQSRPSIARCYQQTDDMYYLASLLIESLIQNHCFANANKRTAMMSGYIFLLLNGYELTAPGDDIVEIAEGLACKEYTREELEDWLAYWGREFDSRSLCGKGFKSYMDFMQINIDIA
ncbi:type II toxin-antitoxin system death-on-curing family toxin [Pantoea dispersa]|uniref:type II toxin-antitoxin system death-on-curing family toxin n=1 Tax=Pantoea dispersa TaxID=59814 RepID=UPI001BA65C36|nr:type II toxin-antitoxin system death-on-curing family toxin [Pantoea dispersa]MBS0898414.1 type II toxin-antitoxin system death-on-curing family toxin [Pantoea dispersa]